MWGLVAKILAFVLYLGLMVWVGLRSASGNRTSKDFFLGSRKMGPWVTALSAEASDSSAWVLMGLPGLCYLGGFKETLWTSLGLIVGTYLAWLIIAKPLRKCSVAFGDSITIPEFFTNRLKDKTHLLTIVSVVFIVIFFTIYTASGFVACAKLFGSVFGLRWELGLLIGFVIILSYTITGGYKAVCTTDFIQGVLIFVAFALSSVIIIASAGGLGGATENVKEFLAKATDGQLGEAIKTKVLSNRNFSAMNAASAFVWCLGYFGMPHIIVRFMSCRSNKELTTARRVGISWMVLSYIGTFIIGTAGAAYLLNKGLILDENTSETVFSEVMIRLYPAFIAGIFLCAILAAAMSTADSQLLSASSAVSQDIFKGIIDKKASDRTVMMVSRVSVLVIAIVALYIARNPDSSIFNIVAFAWSGFGAVFGPIVLLCLYWRGLTGLGAICAMVAAGVTDVVWHTLRLAEKVPNIYEILPAFAVGLAVAVIVSLIKKQDDAEILAEFDKYKALED